MVSGFVISPRDQDKIFSGEASLMEIDLKSVTFVSMVLYSYHHFAALAPALARLGLGPGLAFLDCRLHALEFHIERERFQFVDQNVKRSGEIRIFETLPAHDRVVSRRASQDVVRFYREHLLQGV